MNENTMYAVIAISICALIAFDSYSEDKATIAAINAGLEQCLIDNFKIWKKECDK